MDKNAEKQHYIEAFNAIKNLHSNEIIPDTLQYVYELIVKKETMGQSGEEVAKTEEEIVDLLYQHPESIMLLTIKGCSCLRKNDAEQALKYFDKAIQIDNTKSAPLLRYKGLTLNI